MSEAMNSPSRVLSKDELWADVSRASRRIPPLWDLANFVAVNPFLGYVSTPLNETARRVREELGAEVLPDLAYFQKRWREGAFRRDDLERAAARHGRNAETLAAVIEGRREVAKRLARPGLTFAEWFDLRDGTQWEEAVVRQITRWCAVHASGGGTFWELASTREESLYASWKEAARVDRTLEILGMCGFRAWVTALPEQPLDALALTLERLDVAPDERERYLVHLLAGVYGWASYFRREAWQRSEEEPGAILDLLAIRACLDAAVVELTTHRGKLCRDSEHLAHPRGLETVEDESVRATLQEALEDGFAHRMLGRILPPASGTNDPRPDVQAVFCIDVRSEALRRHLEAESTRLETRGFAGFFGVALDWRADASNGSARCPVLLSPTLPLEPIAPITAGTLAATAKQLQAAPAGAFNFVELLGMTYGLGLVADVFATRAARDDQESHVPFSLEPETNGSGIALERRVEVAAGILKNLGLRQTFGRIVMLCGHESHTANNPHAAGLDCGACGGHGGAINARVAAAILNDPEVRALIAARGWAIPADTYVLPAVHNTTIDAVTLLDLDRVPDSHHDDVAQLRRWLDAACEKTRVERAEALGFSSPSASRLNRLLRRRARDWSEVRPEWGLARNAAFIAARRCRTRGVDLQSRAFLHEYDARLDPDGSVLALILSAPMVVASWINLQYFASTIDNAHFGSGTKTIHNRVGKLGVVLGNGGDLRTGLALQSVHSADGSWFHEPLRLQVVVEAPRERIEFILTQHSTVRDLVDNGWVRLFALDPDGTAVHLRLPGGGWEAAHESSDDAPRKEPACEPMLI